MNFTVMSRRVAADFSTQQNIEPCIIVSITDVGSSPNVFADNPNIKAILPLQFDDVEIGEENCITRDQAQQIIDFVNEHVHDVDHIVVHCEAGVSRSAGVCAALMTILTGDDSAIFNKWRYCPNMTCYRYVLEGYFGTYDQDLANLKLAENIRLWRIHEGLDSEDTSSGERLNDSVECSHEGLEPEDTPSSDEYKENETECL